jgi:hypothetical protein
MTGESAMMVGRIEEKADAEEGGVSFPFAFFA